MKQGRPTKTDIKKRALIEALEKSLGVVTTACKMIGVHRSMYYEWYAEDPDFKNKVDEISEVTLDFAESQLHKQISEGSTPATIFLLKTKGKSRGYVERHEIDNLNTDPIEVTIVRTRNEDQRDD